MFGQPFYFNWGCPKSFIYKSFIYMGVCKTPLHNILQKLLIIRIINFAKGASRTSRELWQSVTMQK